MTRKTMIVAFMVLAAPAACGGDAVVSATGGESGGGTQTDGGGSTTGDQTATSAAQASDSAGSTSGASVCPEAPTDVFAPPLNEAKPWPGASLAPCERHLVSIAVPKDAVFEVELMGEDAAPLTLEITWPDDPTDILQSQDGPGSMFFASPRSGEFFAAVSSDTAMPADAPIDYTLALTCVSGCEQVTTRFPVVLVHGWTGWNSIGPLEYFFGVADDLLGRGYPLAVATLDPYNHVDVRSVQLASFTEETLATWRARKVNYIAHSQGGLDSRAAISTLGLGPSVGKLITISTPHQGTPIGDIALGFQPSPVDDVLYLLLDMLGAVGGFESDAEASLLSLSETYVQGTFNPANPDHPDVVYESFAGRTCMSLFVCDDICDVPIQFTHEILNTISGDNDGMVPVASAIWGEYRGEMAADHFDEIGQVAGVTGLLFNHRAFYRDRADELRADGF